jgi:hypothetical protein
MSVSVAALKLGVEALLDTGTLSTTTTPTSAQVEAWLYEGAMLMCEIFPPEQLSWLEKIITGTAGETVDLSALNAMKVSSVIKNGFECTKLHREELLRMKRMGPLMFSASNIAYCITGGHASGGVTSLQFYPTTSLTYEVRYIAYPLAAASWAASATALAPPTNWAGALVDYAVLRAKAQDEEMEQSEQSVKRWTEKIQLTVSNSTIGTKGS